MIFVIGLDIIFAAAAIVCMPLLRVVSAEAGEAGGKNEARVRWEKRKREAYSAIKEADLDFQMGKLAPEDYRAIRRAEEARALEALRAIEREGPVGGGKRREDDRRHQ
jgi:hypothetical protein